MENETKKPSVKERIILISNEIRVGKEGKNEFTKSGYFQPDDILKAINPLLEKYKLISVFNMVYSKEKEMYEGKLIIEDFNSTENTLFSLDIPMQELKGAGRAQSAGATQTYCKRYMMMNAFNLADNKADLDHKDNKPATSKGKKTVEEILIKIRTVKTTKDIEVWKNWIPTSGYSQPQQNVMMRTLEEVAKTVK